MHLSQRTEGAESATSSFIMACMPSCPSLSRSSYNVWMVALAFLSLFCAYNTLQVGIAAPREVLRC